MELGPIKDLDAWAAEATEKLEGRPVVASISGGKDSTAMALLLQAAGIPFTSVNLDTGWEHEDTIKYIKEYLPTVIGPILTTKTDKAEGLGERAVQKGIFPSRRIRWCTEELKILPFAKVIKSLEEEPVVCVGIRAEESQSRAGMPVWGERSRAYDCEVWRPIKNWSEQDVIAIHNEFGVLPNPLYLRGARRVGCWPCILGRKSEIRLVADTDPDRIVEIRRLEKEVAEVHRQKCEARGEEQGHPPTFFRAKIGKGFWPIDRVVEWSRTARGGKQFELFTANESDAGCMRWGLCETVASEGDMGWSNGGEE